MVICPYQKNLDPIIDIKINDMSLEQVDNTKFLGVIFNKNLNWKNHIDLVTDKVTKISAAIYKAGNNLTEDSKLYLYNSLALPHILYGNLAWGNDEAHLYTAADHNIINKMASSRY